MAIGYDITSPLTAPFNGFIHDFWIFNSVESDIAALMEPSN